MVFHLEKWRKRLVGKRFTELFARPQKETFETSVFFSPEVSEQHQSVWAPRLRPRYISHTSPTGSTRLYLAVHPSVCHVCVCVCVCVSYPVSRNYQTKTVCIYIMSPTHKGVTKVSNLVDGGQELPHRSREWDRRTA